MARDYNFEQDKTKLTFGSYGLRILTTTSVAGEEFGCIYATEASQIDFTNTTPYGDTTITDLVLPAGGVIYGNISDVTVDSGKVIGYLKNI